MSKGDKKALAPTEEQIFSSDIKGRPLEAWPIGKRFMASSDRTILLFDPYSDIASETGQSVKGKIFRFTGTESRMTPDLKEECVINFTDGTEIFRYATGKSTESALKEIESSKLPLMTDLTLVEEWKEKLLGLHLWTRSGLWYDAAGHRIDGLKFAEVKVTDIRPSAGDFPIMVEIQTPSGDTAYMHMNYTRDMADSRSFPDMFLLSDPKSKYPHITEENWRLIQQGRIGLGMTKEECRLSIGTPDDLDAGRNHSQTLDIWKYSDGTYLIFTDGLLTRYRQ